MPDSTHERDARFWKRNLADRPLPSIPRYASLRNVQSGDIPALGLLFFAAFEGTIDDAGQTVTQYTSKARAIVGGRYGEWIAEASWTVERTEGLQSACLVCDYKPYGSPVIAVVATTPASKMSGIAGTVLDAVLASLAAMGRLECCAMITKGNVASERLFESRGFLIF